MEMSGLTNMAMRKLILVVEEDVCSYLEFDDSFPLNVNSARDLTDDPKMIEIDLFVEVKRGWIYDGTRFYNPLDRII